MDDALSPLDCRLQILVPDRRDPGCNMARYYVLSVRHTLFGESALLREWGRIGSSGRHRLDIHATDAEAGEALQTWLARKVRRGYRIRPEPVDPEHTRRGPIRCVDECAYGDEGFGRRSRTRPAGPPRT